MSSEARDRPRNIFGIRTGTLHPDGRLAPWEVADWQVLRENPGQAYLAFGPEEDTGEMRYRVAVRLTDLDPAAGEPGYLGEVLVVKHLDEIDPARTRDPVLDRSVQPLARYRALLEYGLCAPVYQCAGFWEEPESPWTPYDRVLAQEEDAWGWVKERTEEEAAQVYGLLGFYLDRPLNRLGATGWDLLEGDLLGPLGRATREAGTP